MSTACRQKLFSSAGSVISGVVAVAADAGLIVPVLVRGGGGRGVPIW